ncbi:peptide chain release factor N(5)-glutamine methyltransferase [Thioalkalivibrio sp. AKL19]|uniref:peptide chain release factor N(5)-glutamine methyltransferase n=1 Tax=Thioalkalivibrio sp. AKL19 TaxID=1266914 RepID=UPI0003FB6D56|nr:peptide chain release factor N(5)-glutamine methyltransferase [Thioalkalivibrio sp. AKL19]
MEARASLDSLLRDLRTRLQDAGIENPGLEARMLLGTATGQGTAQLIAHGNDAATAEQAARVDALCQRRCAGEPMAHILGRRSFWTLELGVSPACLIPRPETELLVEHALAAVDACSHENPRVLDLGTGTGAIILALKAERPVIEAVASDRSLDALRQARANADGLGLDVAFLQGTWLAPLKPRGTFNVIVSNPPYIAPDDAHLAHGDVRFEPRAALVAADAGLADLRTIIHTAGEHLAPSGRLLLEHGFDQARAVRRMLKNAGYTAIRSHVDMAGHVRITEGLLIPEGPA